jgi:hypothetical protein
MLPTKKIVVTDQYIVKPNGGWKGEAQDYCAWAVDSEAQALARRILDEATHGGFWFTPVTAKSAALRDGNKHSDALRKSPFLGDYLLEGAIFVGSHWGADENGDEYPYVDEDQLLEAAQKAAELTGLPFALVGPCDFVARTVEEADQAPWRTSHWRGEEAYMLFHIWGEESQIFQYHRTR